MAETRIANTKASPVVALVRADKMKDMFEERLGKRAGQFITSLISLANNNKGIAQCEPMTVIQAALTAASMDLPINQNLGFAYIVPYDRNFKDENGNWQKVKEAQFQMGWKGFVQLAQRSGQFRTINMTEVREGEFSSRDRMTGELKFIWNDDDQERQQMEVVGYLAYFELLNGFSKMLYMSKSDIEGHANRYSQAYRGAKEGNNRSSFKTPWETDFDFMAQKTVLKQLLSKFAPLSTEMQEAIIADQSISDGNERRYIDNQPDEMDGVGANDSEQDDILAANGGAPANVDPATGEVKEEPKSETKTESKTANSMDAPKTEDGKKVAPKKTVKQMAEERGWSKGNKQATLVDDESPDTSS